MKKFFGIMLIIFGSILSIATSLSSLPLIVKDFAAILKDGLNAYLGGRFLGSIIVFLLLMALAIFLILKGAKLIKHSRIKPNNTVEEY